MRMKFLPEQGAQAKLPLGFTGCCEALLRQINAQRLPQVACTLGERKHRGLSDTAPAKEVSKQLVKPEELRNG